MTYSVRNIAIALLLAAVAAGLVIVYTGNVTQQANQSQQTTAVVVASSDIPAGTDVKQALAHHELALEQVVRRDVIPGAFIKLDQLNPSLATAQPITGGSQVTSAMFQQSTDNPIVDQISGTTRAVQISLDGNAVLKGTLQAGDHVDLIAAADQGKSAAARVIATDIPVLSTSTSGVAAADLGADPAHPSVILAIPVDTVPKVNYALDGNVLYIVLRPGRQAQGGPDTLGDCKTVFADGTRGEMLSEALKFCAGAK